jgi:hypothetical protein
MDRMDDMNDMDYIALNLEPFNPFCRLCPLIIRVLVHWESHSALFTLHSTLGNKLISDY